ncbi:hypothetical protein DY000_02031298 [Brassica cretica]|uniref:DUF1985 domain-containing protein n=1 Tax=Brassica cretica TaxID=69181 RepID=A0ABQ7DPZ7_BRACR|nr:hypothetical protein DY000_02031298 [Brassica cretica]
MVMDLETFEQHPWGYEAFTDLVFSIKGITPERDIPTSETPTPPLLLMFRGSETNKAYLQKNLQDGRMYHELAKKTIEKVDKFEGQVNGLSHDVEELKHDNSMRGDNHLAAT